MAGTSPNGGARILICDDSVFARTQLKAMLVSHGHQVIGEAATAAQAVELNEKLKPDVVTMDLNMPGANGLEAVIALKEKHPGCRVVVVTAAKDEAASGDISRMGVPIVLKPVRWEELDRAIGKR